MTIIKKHLAHHPWHMFASRSVKVVTIGACPLTVGGPNAKRGTAAIGLAGLLSAFLALLSLAPSAAHAELAEVPAVGPVAGGEATFVNDAIKVNPSKISGPTNVTVTWEIICKNANYYQYTVSAHDGTGAVVSLDGSGNLVLAHASHDEHSSGTVTVTARVPPGQTYTIALEDPWCGNDTSGSFVHATQTPTANLEDVAAPTGGGAGNGANGANGGGNGRSIYPSPNASPSQLAKAYGKYCGGSKDATCLKAMAALATGKSRSPQSACKSESKKKVAGQKHTRYWRCVYGGKSVLKASRRR
jgi:hypothetical protein